MSVHHVLHGEAEPFDRVICKAGRGGRRRRRLDGRSIITAVTAAMAGDGYLQDGQLQEHESEAPQLAARFGLRAAGDRVQVRHVSLPHRL